MDEQTAIRRDDYGFFGPDSPSWKVWAAPTALIGFQRRWCSSTSTRSSPPRWPTAPASTTIYRAGWTGRWRTS